MKIPKYIEELMERAQYEYDERYYRRNKDTYSTGYTIRIEKRSDYSKIDTLQGEMDRLKTWVERQPGGEFHLLDIPEVTHYHRQYAVVTIFDPVMKYIESFIPSEEKWKQRRISK